MAKTGRYNSAVPGTVICALISGMLSGSIGAADAQTRISQAPWGTLSDGSPVTRYTLTNAHGANASFMPLGAAILSLEVPESSGILADVVLGFDAAADYNTGNGAQFGLTIGRYANRLFGTQLTIGEQTYPLDSLPNRDGTPGRVVLHGGPEGFGTRVWTASTVEDADGPGVRFTLVSPDGDQGFPGEMTASVTYLWTDEYRLIVDYQATATKPTVVNLTQHSYFNLKGAGNGDILDHTLQIAADFYTFALPDNRPTGEILLVHNTPFDFTSPKPIGRDIAADDPQMLANRGYNQNYVLRGSSLPGAQMPAATLHDPESGRIMNVFTSEPGLFLYTANFIDSARTMKGGLRYPQRAGVALETGHFPDSPNLLHFPGTTLLPGEIYKSRTVFAFSFQ